MKKQTDITDDAEAQAFLLRAGVLDGLQISLTGPAKVLAVFVPGFPLHWVIGFRFANFEDSKENGYLVKAWPRKKFPWWQICGSLAQLFPNVQLMKFPEAPSKN